MKKALVALALAKKLGGDGGTRTHVQSYSTLVFYMLSTQPQKGGLHEKKFLPRTSGNLGLVALLFMTRIPI